MLKQIFLNINRFKKEINKLWKINYSDTKIQKLFFLLNLKNKLRIKL